MTEQFTLVGDVGGTNARFALARRENGKLIQLHQAEKLANDNHSSFIESLSTYIQTLETIPTTALFALAGPVSSDGSIKLVNRDWPVINPLELKHTFNFSSVGIVNDFAAMSRSIPEVADQDLVSIISGTADATEPIVVTGPGTGFGVGTLLRINDSYHVISGEGGHAAFAPQTELELELFRLLSKNYEYIPIEMIVSGAWLDTVFNAVSDIHGADRRSLTADDILKAAQAGEPVSKSFCELRAGAIMSAAGNCVLTNGARGGAVLTGGVAERMIDWLRTEDAISRFKGRGNHTDYMDGIPVAVLSNSYAALLGAAALQFDKI